MPGSRKPMISLAAATGLLEAIQAAGVDVEQVLRPLHLDRKRLMNAHGFIASVDFALLLEEAAAATGDDCFGLHFGARFDPRNAGAVAYVVLHSPTIGAAMANAARYLRVHNEGAVVDYVREPPQAFLRHVLVAVPPEHRRQHAEYSLALALRTIRLMAGSSWSPLEVQFEHKAPSDATELLRVFGAPVSFGCSAGAFVVDLDFADRPIPAADPRLYPILTSYLDGMLAALPPEDEFVAALRRAISEAVRRGKPSLTEVAHGMALGARTLQRRLTEAGVDFKTLADDTRRRLALRYLDDPKNTVTEIAYLLGYSETSAFNRAFRRWTGSTPLRHRRGKLRTP